MTSPRGAEIGVELMGSGIQKIFSSVHRENRTNCAYLKVWNGSPKLNDNHDDNANSNYGTVVFRRDCFFSNVQPCWAFVLGTLFPPAKHSAGGV